MQTITEQRIALFTAKAYLETLGVNWADLAAIEAIELAAADPSLIDQHCSKMDEAGRGHAWSALAEVAREEFDLAKPIEKVLLMIGFDPDTADTTTVLNQAEAALYDCGLVTIR